MISRIFGSFEIVSTEKIEAGDRAADLGLAFKSKKQRRCLPITRLDNLPEPQACRLDEITPPEPRDLRGGLPYL
jgi:hypothetical protein